MRRFENNMYDSYNYILREIGRKNLSVISELEIDEMNRITEEKNEPLKFVALGEGQEIIVLSTRKPNLEYSFDGKTWTVWDGTEEDGYYAFTPIPFETIYVRGNNPAGLSSGDETGSKFSFGTDDVGVECSGNIMSLLGEGVTDIPCNCCFNHLFEGLPCLTSSPTLPATNLKPYCYSYMFKGTSLTATPELPATDLTGMTNCYSHMFENCEALTEVTPLPSVKLTTGCYLGMFTGCTSLESSPALPGTKLYPNCYALMFEGCTSLTEAPELPAILVAEFCYSSMFKNCVSLVTAPTLPAPALMGGCYSNMFAGCENLDSITCLATDISALDCTLNWTSGVAEEGSFTRSISAESWTTGVNGIPTGWLVNKKDTGN